MNIIYGDMLEIKCGLLVHQVNCKGVMGRGIAKQVRDKFPNVYRAYLKVCNTSCIGKVQMVQVSERLTICNLFGQIGFGSDRKYTSPVDFEIALDKAMKYATEHKLKVYVPYKIGCGLGGADWDNEILPVLNKYPQIIIVKYHS